MEDNVERNVFLYWIGEEYKLILILRKLIYLHSKNGKGYNVKLITHENIKDYICDLPDYFYKLRPAQQADFVRVNVICDYGGIWLDSDTLVIDSLDSLFNIIEEKDGFFVKENNKMICNGIFGSKKNTKFIKEWKNIMKWKLDSTKGIIGGWSELGSKILKRVYKLYRKSLINYTIFNGLDNLYPVNWDRCEKEFIYKPYNNYKKIVREYQPLVVLVNSVYKSLENKSEEEILSGNMPLNYFINKSYENLKKMNIMN